MMPTGHKHDLGRLDDVSVAGCGKPARGTTSGGLGRGPVDSGGMTAAPTASGDQTARRAPSGRGLERFAAMPWPPILLALAAVPILVWLGRDMTFYHDEYAFLLLRDLSVQGIFAPHNEHLSATLVILYRVLVGTVGTVSYWPYLGVTFALHWRSPGSSSWSSGARRRDGALGAMAVMLILGSGGDDILWAFQSATIGATAAGMAAIVVAPRRPAVAAILLTVALATSGVGLAFLCGTALHLLLTRPRALVWLALPVGLYLGWLVLFGAQRMVALREPSPDGVPEYVLSGLAASAAGAIGSASAIVGQLALLALAFGLGWARKVSPVVLSLLVSSVAFFAIAGLVRAQLGPEQAAAPRYVYVAAPGLLITGAVLLARLRRPWRNAIGATVLAVALVGNLLLLVDSHDRFVAKIECERTMTPIARGSAGNPC